MPVKKTTLFIGDMPIYQNTNAPEGGYVRLLGERYYRISDYDQMPPFLMSLVSSTDHWLFISSSGGMTAGRVNADSALFPYETEDKLAAHSEWSGSKSIIQVHRDGKTYLWEPFSERCSGVYRRQRCLYKNIYGNKVIFEEVNQDLQLTIRTGWFTGDRFGFIKGSWLQNDGGSGCQIELLDGLQNLLPYGATAALQNSMSSLLNAYKRSEIDAATGLGVFALSATITDRPEPSESLKATTAWQVGLDAKGYLLCGDQLDAFRTGLTPAPERDVRGKPGAYFAYAEFELPPNQSLHWRIVADVNQDSAAIVRLKNRLRLDEDSIIKALDEDIDGGTSNLVRYVGAADGLQMTAQEMTTSHHFANVLFNVMRGGIFPDGYQIQRDDLLDFVNVRNKPVLAAHADWFEALPEQLFIQELWKRAADSSVPDLIRLCYEYLPLSFSRRHGDPSRPWNKFSINLKNPDGSLKLDYQGNWRDIFQNWEPLALSFPSYVLGMVAKFLNATTADGYNPYRVTRDGIEWEVPEPDSPWSNIGYWSDHQIIYLQKLLEITEKVRPGVTTKLWNQSVFSYANVPYRIRPYREMLADWNKTIDFDWAGERNTEAAVAKMGTDARLIRDAAGNVMHATMVEKLLVLLLAKLTNLVPEGGIWMNTQRPEWNDANNALAGKGLSVVTAAYLRRFLAFWKERLASSEPESYAVNDAVFRLFNQVQRTFVAYQDHLDSGFSDQARRAIMDELGMAAAAYRTALYEKGLTPAKRQISSRQLYDFLTLSLDYIEQTLYANWRQDGLAHSYNTLHISDREAAVEKLYLMLEGQVAFLSSGILEPEEGLALLQKLRQSDLYRADLHTYMLYPNRTLPGFFQKNNISAAQLVGSALAAALIEAGDSRLLIRDEDGVYHFNGAFHNAGDVGAALDDLAEEAPYTDLVETDRVFILKLFESTFSHREFTGRSGTFFAYEGLGSVYWHMVSKLLLAAQESYQQAVDQEADPTLTARLAKVYYDIRHGLGFNKSPAEYGAFPADPYSHTPMGGGARQPGMTGQVKEEILTRFGELGVSIRRGALSFKPTLLKEEEYLPEVSSFTFVDTTSKAANISLPPNSLAFTICQTPVIYVLAESSKIDVLFKDGRTETISGCSLDTVTSQHIFDRDGQIEMLWVSVES